MTPDERQEARQAEQDRVIDRVAYQIYNAVAGGWPMWKQTEFGTEILKIVRQGAKDLLDIDGLTLTSERGQSV